MTPSVYAILVKDYIFHDGGSDPLDTKERAAWAWEAVRSSPYRRSGAIGMLQLDVEASTVNGRQSGGYVDMLRCAVMAIRKTLPLIAKSWDPAAPDSMQANIAAKINALEKSKSILVPVVDDLARKSEATLVPLYEYFGVYMCDLSGAKRAVLAMLVASVFAAELSHREGVPVLVVGRPPGHHATCGHELRFGTRPWISSPSGMLAASSLGGGCFYPSCWLAAVHSLRQGFASRPAYVDVDAHKPDGIWKEVNHLCRLNKSERAAVLGGKEDACRGVLFSSVHVDGFPGPEGEVKHTWTSVRQTIPKSVRRGFEIRVNEELLPSGVGVRGSTSQKRVLESYEQWKKSLLEDLQSFGPDSLFVGLGFDLHKEENVLEEKRRGVGMEERHYRQLFGHPVLACIRGPVVLTFEGGYTEAGVVDGMNGVLAGLVKLTKLKQKREECTSIAKRGFSARGNLCGVFSYAARASRGKRANDETAGRPSTISRKLKHQQKAQNATASPWKKLKRPRTVD